MLTLYGIALAPLVIPNRSQRDRTGKVMCGYCADEGWVVVNLRKIEPSIMAPNAEGLAEEMGPCPHCEAGKRIEYPHTLPGPWGPNGYWRDKDTSILVPIETGRPVKDEQAAERARAMAGSVVGPAGERVDPMRRLLEQLEGRPPGLCDDCKESTVRGKTSDGEEVGDPRFVYGKFLLCRGCVMPRARLAGFAGQGQLEMEAF